MFSSTMSAAKVTSLLEKIEVRIYIVSSKVVRGAVAGDGKTRWVP